MERRTFIKLGLLSPLFLKTACQEQYSFPLLVPKENEFDFLEVSGSYKEIGIQIGRKIAGTLREILEERHKWFNDLQQLFESSEIKAYSDKILKISKNKYPHLIEELEGIAEGSELSFENIWLMNIKNELMSFEQTPGCSTIYYKDEQNTWLFHNEDGNKAYSNKMLVLKVNPPSGVSFFNLLYPGLTAGVGPGFNNYGICQSTNYISTTKPGIGVPRYLLGRAVFESKSLFKAVEIAADSPRAHPWHHNVLSFKNNSYASVETLPDDNVNVRYPENGIYVHTNHLLGEKTHNYQFENESYKGTSSMPRYKTLNYLISNTDISKSSFNKIMRFLGSHKSKPYSPCRHPENDINGQTLATVHFDSSMKIMRVYKGNPCKSFPRGHFKDYSF